MRKLSRNGLGDCLPTCPVNAISFEERDALAYEEKDRLVPNCKNCASPCGKNADYDMKRIRDADEDIRSLKSLILTALEGMAVYAYNAEYSSDKLNSFFLEALRMLSYDLETEQLISFAMKVGKQVADIKGLCKRQSIQLPEA